MPTTFAAWARANRPDALNLRSPDGVLSYDELGGPVSLNGANFRVCGCQNGPPCTAGNKMYACPLGTGQLQGTGFGDKTISRFAVVSRQELVMSEREGLHPMMVSPVRGNPQYETQALVTICFFRRGQQRGR